MSQKQQCFNNYMQIAIKEAVRGMRQNTKTAEIPIGCIIVDNTNGTIIAKSHNKIVQSNNPTQHAEIVCINKALHKIKSDRLSNHSMYVTLEPCSMCAAAIALVKIKKLYIGCLSQKTGAVISNLNYFDTTLSNHKPEIFYPIMDKECKILLTNFFKTLR